MRGKLQKPSEVDHAVAGMRCTSGNALLYLKTTTNSPKMKLLTLKARSPSVKPILGSFCCFHDQWRQQSWTQNNLILMESFQLMTVQGQRQTIDLFRFSALSISDTGIQVFLCSAHGGWWLLVPPLPPPSPGGIVQELTLVGNRLS